ncbi:D-2-hydroxyacid dehydrogenase [Desulfotomaculum defluvii]
MKTVFLNTNRLDFDNKLDFSPIAGLTSITKYEASTNEEILDRVEDQNIIITKELPVGRDLITKFPSTVKLICEAGTGYNNIDIATAKEKNIMVCNVPGYSTEAVAELVVTFILNFSKSLSLQQQMIKQGNFINFTKDIQVPNFEVQNKTLGIICGGSIGQQVMKIALVLGMNVLVYNRTPKQWGDPSIQAVSLEELLQKSDFVSIHCPLNENTKYLINKEKLKLMKPTAFIINTSRGQIIKETDLIEALQNKIIAGAALDVQEKEPPEQDNPLFAMENVFLTPHIGWKCLESRQRLINLMANNIASFLQGNPINVVS